VDESDLVKGKGKVVEVTVFLADSVSADDGGELDRFVGVHGSFVEA